MWPVPEIQSLLPEHLHVCEDTDFVVLRCKRCPGGVWFSALGAGRKEIERTARNHRCQDTEGTP